MPKAGQHDYGVIAQDVIKIFPDIISTNKDDYYNIKYSKMVPILTKAIQEQQILIEDLQREIKEIKKG